MSIFGSINIREIKLLSNFFCLFFQNVKNIRCRKHFTKSINHNNSQSIRAKNEILILYEEKKILKIFNFLSYFVQNPMKTGHTITKEKNGITAEHLPVKIKNSILWNNSNFPEASKRTFLMNKVDVIRAPRKQIFSFQQIHQHCELKTVPIFF